MPVLTIRLPDKILHEVDLKSKSLHLSKNAYIQKAINDLNEEINYDLKKKKLIKASQKVRSNTMKINNEFSAIDNDPEI